MKCKEAILKTIEAGYIDDIYQYTVEPKSFDYTIESQLGLEFSESAIRSACEKMVKDGLMKRTKVWHGKDMTHWKSMYYRAYQLIHHD